MFARLLGRVLAARIAFARFRKAEETFPLSNEHEAYAISTYKHLSYFVTKWKPLHSPRLTSKELRRLGCHHVVTDQGRLRQLSLINPQRPH